VSDLTWGGIHIDHPGARDREQGQTSKVWIAAHLPSGKTRRIDLTEDQLLALIADGALLLRVLRKRS